VKYEDRTFIMNFYISLYDEASYIFSIILHFYLMLLISDR